MELYRATARNAHIRRCTAPAIRIEMTADLAVDDANLRDTQQQNDATLVTGDSNEMESGACDVT